MRCPFCGNDDTQVKDSRPSDDGRVIRRRRECAACHRRFTTFERFQVQQTVVLKKDGTRELFDREKLLKSVMLALRKRPVNQAAINTLVTDVEQILTENGRSEVTSKEIGAAVLDRLKAVDFVGYMRYASVYHAFTDPADFQKLLRNLK
jgi:transcriptional repressor NrdR